MTYETLQASKDNMYDLQAVFAKECPTLNAGQHVPTNTN